MFNLTVLLQYFHDGFLPADAESHMMLTFPSRHVICQLTGHIIQLGSYKLRSCYIKGQLCFQQCLAYIMQQQCYVCQDLYTSQLLQNLIVTPQLQVHCLSSVDATSKGHLSCLPQLNLLSISLLAFSQPLVNQASQIVSLALVIYACYYTRSSFSFSVIRLSPKKLIKQEKVFLVGIQQYSTDSAAQALLHFMKKPLKFLDYNEPKMNPLEIINKTKLHPRNYE